MNAPDIKLLRKAASIESGRRVFTPETKTEAPSALEVIEFAKVAAADEGLLTIATALQPENPVGMYEKLGGRYDSVKETR